MSDDGRMDSLMIHQHAFASISTLEEGKTVEYKKYREQNGIYLFVISGKVNVWKDTLNKSDAMEIVDEDGIVINAWEKSQVLILEVPMK